MKKLFQGILMVLSLNVCMISLVHADTCSTWCSMMGNGPSNSGGVCGEDNYPGCSASYCGCD